MKIFDRFKPSKSGSDEGTGNAALLETRNRLFLPLALYHDKPLHLKKAQGMHVWDAQGKQYLDCIGGIICISAGHNHPRIKQKLTQMMEDDEIQHISTLYLSEHNVRLAESLVAEAPEGLDRASFTNSGSEANELAFMTARQSTGESIIINLRHSYHGGTAATQAQCGHASWRFRAQPNDFTGLDDRGSRTPQPLQPRARSCRGLGGRTNVRPRRSAGVGVLRALAFSPPPNPLPA